MTVALTQRRWVRPPIGLLMTSALVIAYVVIAIAGPWVISYDHAEKFKAAGIENLAEHFKGKTIRVTGSIIQENQQVRIRVELPEQIKVVD